MKTWEVVTANGIELVTADKAFVGKGGTLIFLRGECITEAFGVGSWFHTELTTPERKLLISLLRE